MGSGEDTLSPAFTNPSTTMRPTHLIAAGLCLLSSLRAQHCAPLYQTYLSEVSMRIVRAERPADDKLRIHVQYAKEGGQDPAAYQGYLIAYLDRNAAKVPAPAPAEVLDPTAMVVLHTQLMKRREQANSPGPQTYDLDFEISCEQLVQKLVEHGKLGAADRDDVNGWLCYRDQIRFALFVPWLEDKEYSVLRGLPEDRHECNYLRSRALLFQELPTRAGFKVSHDEANRGHVWVMLRGGQADPPKPAAK